jgi:hypothetical protein
MIREVWVDFNDVQDMETVTLEKFAPPHLYRGEVVRAFDNDGNSCWASVLRVADSKVRLLLDIGRFQDGEVKK